MLVVFVRALVLYLLVVIVMRIMGKRQIGQLQPFELAVAIMISDLAAIPMQNTGIPLIHGIIPILTLLVAQIVLSLLSFKSTKARGIICGRPNILIEKGRINEDNLIRELYTLNDLLEQLRIKDFPDISDVEFALLETNGEISIIPKSHKRPLVPEDLKIVTKYEDLPINFIIDGDIIHDNLKKANVDEEWLYSRLSEFRVSSEKDVLYAGLDSNGKLVLQEKKHKKR